MVRKTTNHYLKKITFIGLQLCTFIILFMGSVLFFFAEIKITNHTLNTLWHHTSVHISCVQPLLHTCLRRGRLHRVVVEDNVLQLPEFPVSCGNLCDLIAGEVESDERKICQFCRNARERLIKNKHKDRKEKKKNLFHRTAGQVYCGCVGTQCSIANKPKRRSLRWTLTAFWQKIKCGFCGQNS